MMNRVWLAIGILLAACGLSIAGDVEDPFLWLEEVEGEKALDWVEKQNEITISALQSTSVYQPIFKQTMEILDSDERIPYPSQRGEWVYNLWKDENNPRGVLRRTTLESYASEAPEWEVVIDIDKLVEEEGVPWVFDGAQCLPPEERLCMVGLSRGGSDASVLREFDTTKKAFVDGGFSVDEAKSYVAWHDQDHLYVGTDFGEGSLTDSGYPRTIRLWTRGQQLDEAPVLYEGKSDDVIIVPQVSHTVDGDYEMIVRVPVFYRHETFLVLGGRLVKLDVPYDSEIQTIFKDHMVLSLRSEWKIGDAAYPQGSLIAIDLDDFLQGSRDFDVLFEPSERVSLDSVASTRNLLLVGLLDNVRGRLLKMEMTDEGWSKKEVSLPGLGTVRVVDTSKENDTFFFVYQDFLTPSSLFMATDEGVQKIKSMPDFFSTEGMKVAQLETQSKDGERIPYFLVTPKGFEADGTAPTLLYGYGGFENSELPRYRSVTGRAWLERGGVFVVANIRGGGEFGPRWHQAALKENRIKAFEDFIAVAEDLIRRKITSSDHLGIMGGSQGGLLVAGCMTLRPELFGAVVSQVPLTDMKRFNKLLAGASWMGEYGNPDIPEEWAFIKTWSPYHLLDEEADYPKAFFWTTTRDDRVHPGHARKMVAKMIAQGHPVYYFENTEGGHGSGSVSSQQATVKAMEWAYLWKMLR